MSQSVSRAPLLIPTMPLKKIYYLIGFSFCLSGSFSLDVPPDHSVQDDDLLLAVESRNEPKMADSRNKISYPLAIALER